ncbi:ATP-binding cassette domain-containing protein [Rhodocytophaga rosea]|uniref:ATP-binding cassette domain-containing protein n=1 Tax=Rhodocytophaga rosea TaxID=2704465 RepID=A0A6C0GCT5_9BACT|nr:polysaccharide ABC transporter ATP-binding protein [Rhodocytophaga rosea]QHT65781.1 ATP-binding cassette domain-containing protein [Rhodocytophaga rosea]
MSEVVISVEGLGKRYRLGSIGTGTLSQDLNIWWANLRGKENPYAKLEPDYPTHSKDNEFWALKDLNFEISQGQAVGIIGMNGAGKSTLLKILSRITAPTLGEIKVDGRIASLLEVGTGFHPDLTGRENIFLNGAILGMSKFEIRSKLDEIISFSGVEKHIDTPVKRYSSGMHVRLGFAVAAHLEPEILIVDEVLAVGDAEFQKKCIGKMKEVAGEGRTILFVSHNMAAVAKLCSRAILLRQGKIHLDSTVDDAIGTYLNLFSKDSKPEITWEYFGQSVDNVQIIALRLLREDGTICGHFYINENFYIEIEYINLKEGLLLSSYFELRSLLEAGVLSSANWASATANEDNYSNTAFKKGKYKSRMKIPGNLLNEGTYRINAWILENVSATAAEAKEPLMVTIVDTGEMRKEYTGEWFGVVRPKLEWYTKAINDEKL